MKKTGEWGEFFPIEKSPFAFNETLAIEYAPLTESEAHSRGYTWKTVQSAYDYQGPVIKIPDHINDVSDEICSQILTCEKSTAKAGQAGKLYKIIPQELKFLKKLELPAPRRSPDQRHFDRMSRRNPRTLWKRNCAKTGKEIWTTYSPEKPEIVYCEEAYRGKFY